MTKNIIVQHKNKIKKLKKNNDKISKLEKNLIKLNSTYESLSLDCESDSSQKYTIKNKINNVQFELKKLRQEEKKYFLKNTDIITHYLENNNGNKINTLYHDEIIEGESDFESDSETEEEFETFFKIKNHFDKNNLHTEYNSEKQKQVENIWICKNCNIEKLLIKNECKLVCNGCFITDNILIDNDKPNFKEPIQDNSYFHYKRINHFKEWVYKFQAKESTEISKEVYDNIKKEIIKMRITDMSKLTKVKVNFILKKIGYNKYYENIPHIINKLNGQKPPKLTSAQEEIMYSMFNDIHLVFNEIKPSRRANFLSYSYVLYKICELLEYDEFLPCFNLLKNPEKLHYQDIIWKKICEKLNYEYISTI